jgi:hypothetical protein
VEGRGKANLFVPMPRDNDECGRHELSLHHVLLLDDVSQRAHQQVALCLALSALERSWI